MKNDCIIYRQDGTSFVLSEAREISEYFPGLKVDFYGNGSKLVLHLGTRFSGCRCELQANSSVEIGPSSFGINGLLIHSVGGSVKIGKDFSCWGVNFRVQEVGSSIIVGEDCMFSSEILLYPTDIHAIYDIHTLKCLNISQPIVIGNHVWVGRCVKMLKGASVADNSVVGMDSIITKKFTQPHSIIAGSPARIIRQGINWSRESPQRFMNRVASKKMSDI